MGFWHDVKKDAEKYSRLVYGGDPFASGSSSDSSSAKSSGGDSSAPTAATGLANDLITGPLNAAWQYPIETALYMIGINVVGQIALTILGDALGDFMIPSIVRKATFIISTAVGWVTLTYFDTISSVFVCLVHFDWSCAKKAMGAVAGATKHSKLFGFLEDISPGGWVLKDLGY